MAQTEAATTPGRERTFARSVSAIALRAEVPALLALWLALGFGLSRLTGRVVDWFIMTDELLYERLAISVATTGSPLPRLRGEVVETYNQLYPVLIAPAFRDGLVPEALRDAHVVNAFVMTSAAIPAFLLARSAIDRRWAAFFVAVLSVCVPWMTLSSFLLTEVAAYPAFLWAVLAMFKATASPRPRYDALAVLGIALAISARTQFVVLLLALPIAVLIHELGTTRPWRSAVRKALNGHPVLVGAYALAAVTAIVLAAMGRLGRSLGAYGVTIQEDVVPGGIGRAFTEHVATIALAVGILPFLVAAAWMLGTLVRPGERRLHAFASVAMVTLVLLTAEVASFDIRFGGGIVRERYLFYVVPLVLVGVAAAIAAPPWPRWSLLVPTALVMVGFAIHPFLGFEKLNVDTPIAVLYDRILALGQSTEGAQVGLVLTTLVLALLFVEGSRLVRRSLVAATLAAVVAFVLPATTAYAFSRLFALNGTSGRPLTLEQGVVFNWIDRTLGPDAAVTMVPYPVVPGDYWAGVSFWWDLEFWNKSVVQGAYRNEEFQATPSTFPSLQMEFHPRTGAANHSATRYVAQYAADSRFRIAGSVVASDRNTLVIDAGSRWRADWVSRGLYSDGWTKPERTAVVRVFAMPDQAGPVTRFLGVYVRGPGGGLTRRFTVAAGPSKAEGIAGDDGVSVRVELCVPAGGFADAQITADGHSPIVGEPINPQIFSRLREGGVLITQIGLADEFQQGC
jgi:hypothetical protein